MNWLSLLSEPERRAIVAELARLLAQEGQFSSTVEKAVEKVFAVYFACEKCGQGVIPPNHISHICHKPGCLIPDLVLTTAHGPILDLISKVRWACDEMENHNHLFKLYDPLRSAAAAAEAALPKVKL